LRIPERYNDIILLDVGAIHELPHDMKYRRKMRPKGDFPTSQTRLKYHYASSIRPFKNKLFLDAKLGTKFLFGRFRATHSDLPNSDI
jgi:hypothetical protein